MVVNFSLGKGNLPLSSSNLAIELLVLTRIMLDFTKIHTKTCVFACETGKFSIFRWELLDLGLEEEDFIFSHKNFKF